MPEGVEVKISAELIKPLVQNRRVVDTSFTENSRYAFKKPEGYDKFIKYFDSNQNGVYVQDVQTKGKFMYWTFTDNWHLFCTFGMSGQWSPNRGKHPCFILRHTQDMTTNHAFEIVFNDPRHFGTITFSNNPQDLLIKLNKLGWDPLQFGKNQFWINYVTGICARTTKPIGQVLMDQSVFAGVGNYIRAEALYLAKISPWRQSNLMTKDDIKTLCEAVVDVMNESYKHQGATILTYKDAYGAEGKYSSCFKVYGQKTDPLGNKIIKENTPDKRSIHWCPAIQV